MTRRSFIGVGASAMAGAIAAKATVAVPGDRMMWADLLHFGVNIQCDLPVTKWGKYQGEDLKLMTAADHVRFDEGVFDRITDAMAAKGMNTIVIDLEEALFYPSHPELAVKGTWSVERFRKKLAALRAKGLEPLPKLNFSTTHDIWLKDYHRRVSTPEYYKVCADVIADVVETFDKPRFFHIGFDEETAGHQKKHSIAIVRQGDLWWHDFLYIVRQVETRGSRAWCWSDKIWHSKDEFLNRMPKSVLQSNWYYGTEAFDMAARKKCRHPEHADAYLWLDKAGFDQVPTGSNWSTGKNMEATVDFVSRNCAADRIRGYLAAPWVKTLPQFEQLHLEQVDQVVAAKKLLG